MDLHVIVGAGPVGAATARLLIGRGERVRLITRRGGGPELAGIERVAADATDSDTLARHAEGAVALYSCAGPAYHRWAADWPPLGTALIRAAEATGAVLVTTGNLYGYGQVDVPMTEQLPLRPNSVKGEVRAKLWADALAAHEAGRIRTAEVRGSDYLGAGALSPFSAMVLPKVLAGRRGSIPADLDAPHSWTYVGDVARALVAVAADEKAWGRPWHVPTAPPLSIRALATRAAELAEAPAARVATMPGFALRLAGLFNPAAREMLEVQYQMRRPFVLDSSAATAAFGIEPTSTDEALRETIEGLHTTTVR
ncbi:NAD-dependent epimerase/dehydratase family protein [Streptomyces sp. NBS 14/10]|uniref:NAD-dependent epimerase/dehydratase family protein n=1 Tax=Streptomyces sp. NBS 14/10 TaxID=1945643 RepID=UPI000B80030A|nr:NAD-dependent epimerase/dehydratase family protein [Streptomyces sp. NBS 14/10]KAK1181520.1 NAD-dependent epimerase/dehydratase family protein [Streptomyces sp. NBS 14/10]NUS88917.1 NAD-dependent epimerase/dehydratase family protein [Streptomyces sp.]